MATLDDFGAILDSEWKLGEGGKIYGQWPEDGSVYTIQAPAQLAGQIVDLQNELYERMQRVKVAAESIRRAQEEYLRLVEL